MEWFGSVMQSQKKEKQLKHDLDTINEVNHSRVKFQRQIDNFSKFFSSFILLV